MIGFFLLFLSFFFFNFSSVNILSAHLSKARVAQERLQQTLFVFCTPKKLLLVASRKDAKD